MKSYWFVFTSVFALALSAWSMTDTLLGKSPITRIGEIRAYRDFAYGPRPDAPGEGATFKGQTWKDGNGNPVHTHRTGQLFDLWLPSAPGTVPAHAPVFIWVHGGAWCMRWDKDGDAFHLLRRFAEKGFIAINMDYIMENDVLTDGSQPSRPHATWADMLRDIDLMVSYLKTFLPSLGVTPRAVGIGGASAGGHLTTLYAADQANPTALGLGLSHALPVAFVADVVGPVDLLLPSMRDPILTTVKKQAQTGTVPTDMLGRWVVLLGRLSGADVFSAYKSGGEVAVDAVLRRWSPRWHVTSRMPPCILAYNKLHPFASSDGLVDIDNCDALEGALKEAGVPCVSRVSWFCHHGKLKDSCQDWLVDQALSFK